MLAKVFFPYRVEDGTKRPVIAFKAEGRDGRQIQLEGLLDSGADNSIFPYELVEMLGIRLGGEPKNSTGICGDECISGYTAAVNLDVVGKPVICEVEVLLPKHKLDRVILGRKGIFDEHRICFLEGGITIESRD
ncbi:Uncharacterised protein [Candidatus Norongarragalina meridionalis]|nr:Uncharacterised protein [Candidatus Norongarragalina meridionalis]